jgi:hypothetical protein
MGKSTINGPFSIAMLVYQRVLDDIEIIGNYCRVSNAPPVCPKPQNCHLLGTLAPPGYCDI